MKWPPALIATTFLAAGVSLLAQELGCVNRVALVMAPDNDDASRYLLQDFFAWRRPH